MLTYVNCIAAYPLDSRQYSPVMTCQLEIISEHRDIVGDDAIRVFHEEGGTIGRSLSSDWILPDTERFISGSHATIDYRSGAYYLADVSSNGVYVNHDNEPLGKGNPRRLFDGDHLRMGNFEIKVHLDEGEDLEMPPEPKITVVPDRPARLFVLEPRGFLRDAGLVKAARPWTASPSRHHPRHA